MRHVIHDPRRKEFNWQGQGGPESKWHARKDGPEKDLKKQLKKKSRRSEGGGNSLSRQVRHITRPGQFRRGKAEKGKMRKENDGSLYPG